MWIGTRRAAQKARAMVNSTSGANGTDANSTNRIGMTRRVANAAAHPPRTAMNPPAAAARVPATSVPGGATPFISLSVILGLRSTVNTSRYPIITAETAAIDSIAARSRFWAFSVLIEQSSGSRPGGESVELLETEQFVLGGSVVVFTAQRSRPSTVDPSKRPGDGSPPHPTESCKSASYDGSRASVVEKNWHCLGSAAVRL